MAQIAGTSSADILVGTNTADVFSGFAGHDTFVFSASGSTQTDIILDFGGVYFSGVINGAQEVPVVVSSATGTVSAWLNKARTEFVFNAQVNGLDLGGRTTATVDDVTAAHFHAAAAGVSGGVVFGFIGTPNNELQGETSVNGATGTVSGAWDVNEGNNTTLTAQLAAILTNQLYINFHTAANPSGEIRGQLIASDGGLDRIDVSATGIGDFATLQTLMTDVNGSATITVTFNGAPSTLVLQGVTTAQLTAADFIFADATAHNITGSEGADQLFGAAGADIIVGNGGADRIVAGAGADVVLAGDGNDTVQGMEDNDEIHGGAGDDDVNGNTGNDQVFGEDGADTVRGGQGNDTVYGGAGNDPHVNGNIGNDIVYGEAGNDTVYGGQNDDTLYGDAGNDWLSGDLGADLMYGGPGADRFLFRVGAGTDWVNDFNFAEGDRIQLAQGQTYVATSHQGQAMITLGSGTNLGLSGVAASSFSADWVVFV